MVAFIVVTAFMFGLLWLLMTLVPAEQTTPPSRHPTRPPAMTKPPTGQGQNVSRARRAIPRRVIRLHAVTPGQSQHEYNLGDTSGRRGCASVELG